MKKKERSIFSLLMITMLCILITEMIFLAASLIIGNIIPKMNQSVDAYFTRQVETREKQVSMNMGGRWNSMSLLAETINGLVRDKVQKGEIRLEDLNEPGEAVMTILSEITDPLIATMYNKQVSGVYVIFNTDNLEAVAADKECQGIYLRDLDPMENFNYTYGDILLERAPISYVKSHKFSTDTTWEPSFSYEDCIRQDFMRKPFMAAYEAGKKLDSLTGGYWTDRPYSLGKDKHMAISCSLPLQLEDGTVYGVVGIELLTGYLKTLLPYWELGQEEKGSYMIGVTKDDGRTIDPIVISGASFHESDIVKTGMYMTEKNESWTVNFTRGDFTAVAESIAVYPRGNAYADQEWFLIGLYPSGTLYALSRQITLILILAIVVTFLVGSISIFMISRSIAGPVTRLARKVAVASDIEGMPRLENTGIREIDQFLHAITKLSHEIEWERDVDLLTGLYGRRAFIREAEKLLEEHEPGRVTALIMIDMDNLKSTNDRYGHAMGDRYICKLAEVLNTSLPFGTLNARISGDEFLVLLNNYQTKEEILTLAANLEGDIREAAIRLPDGSNLNLSASGGLAWYPENGDNLQDLMRLADFAMYRTKKHRKGEISTFNVNEFEKAELDKMMQKEFRRVLRDDGFRFFFQPIVSAADGRIYAYEMLMRMDSQILVNTEDVFAIARKQHRMRDIERATFLHGMDAYQKLYYSGQVERDAYVFVNSIADVIMSEQDHQIFAEKYEELSDHVVIEITESEDMDLEKIQIKRGMPWFSGYFALDDYGSGYNSEKNLLRLEPKYIKIDIMFVQNIDTDPDRQEVVRNITQYAHQRDMLVIAEGIETRDEMEKVLDIGVDLLQGFYIARPAEIPEEISPVALRTIREFRGSEKG